MKKSPNTSFPKLSKTWKNKPFKHYANIEAGIKQANAKKRFSISIDNQIEYNKCEAEPVYFIEKYLLDEGKSLFDYQKDAIEMFQNNPHSLVFGSRQVGLTLLLELYLTWLILFKSNERILLMSEKMDFSTSILKKIVEFVKKVPHFLSPHAFTYSNKRKIELSNGSKIIISSSVCADAGRGENITLFIVDNASFIEHSENVKQLLNINKCKSILTSTSNGFDKLFYDLWANDDKYAKKAIHWSQCPFFNEDLEIELNEDPASYKTYYTSPKYKELCKSLINRERIAQELDLSFDEESLTYEQIDKLTHSYSKPLQKKQEKSIKDQLEEINKISDQDYWLAEIELTKIRPQMDELSKVVEKYKEQNAIKYNHDIVKDLYYAIDKKIKEMKNRETEGFGSQNMNEFLKNATDADKISLNKYFIRDSVTPKLKESIDNMEKIDELFNVNTENLNDSEYDLRKKAQDAMKEAREKSVYNLPKVSIKAKEEADDVANNYYVHTNFDGCALSAGTLSYNTSEPLEFRANSGGSINLTNGSNSVALGIGRTFLTGTSISALSFNTHSVKDELIETIVTEETIELVYKSTIIPNYWISNGWNNQPSPEIKIYKNVYGRFDGSIKRVEGKYIPPMSSEETYEF